MKVYVMFYLVYIIVLCLAKYVSVDGYKLSQPTKSKNLLRKCALEWKENKEIPHAAKNITC